MRQQRHTHRQLWLGALLLLAACGGSTPVSERAPAAPAPQRARVPAQTPDTVPAWVYDHAHWEEDSPLMSGTFLRNMVLVVFQAGATQPERQAAVDLINGEVVGGVRAFGDEGFYFVRIADDGTAGPLFRAMGLLESLPQVSIASPELIFDDMEWEPVRGAPPAGAPPAAQRPPVPLIPPDTLPSRAVLDSIYAKENALWTDPRFAEGTPRNIIFLSFHNHATQQDRQQTVDLVQGEVIGGIRIGTGGLYIIRIPSDGTGEPLARALVQLQALPQVSLAGEHPLGTGPAGEASACGPTSSRSPARLVSEA